MPYVIEGYIHDRFGNVERVETVRGVLQGLLSASHVEDVLEELEHTFEGQRYDDLEVKHIPPKDIKQWWQSDCCGPCTEDTSEHCGFCGKPVLECARKHSDYVRDNPGLNHDGSILGDGYDDPEDTMTCGGSGFWCSGCGRFWAQDSCGNHCGSDHLSSNGAKLQTDKNRKVFCSCGKWLLTERPVTE